jgi:hypothetical protein
MKKVNKKNCYSVSNKLTKRVFSNCTTKNKAKKQIKLLLAIENNKDFVSRRGTKKHRS